MKPNWKPKTGKGPERAAFRIVLEYDGSRYQGWQKQSEKQTGQGVRTVAGTLERVLLQGGFKVLNLTGSGRTDGGVHASAQVAHLHLAPPVPRPMELRRVFDEGLPSDIAIREIAPCPASFHARHDATFRTYLYQISLRRSAFAKPYVWWIKAPLSLDKLQKAWSSFEGVHDFTSFADLEPGESPQGHVRCCQCVQEGDLILLRITAGHFLRRQVRRMVGAAVQVALGRESPELLQKDLERPSSEANLYWAEKAAPSSGLFLERVGYPGDEIEMTGNGLVSVR